MCITAKLDVEEDQTCESIKHTDGDGIEFWHAREPATVPQYKNRRNFAKVIDRAMPVT